MPPEEARRAARKALGNIPLLEEQCRDQRRVTWLHDFLQDLQYASRQFRRDRSVTLLLVLTIALGIGVNTAVFSMVNGVTHPLPVKEPDQIVVLAAETQGDETGFAYRFSYPALQDLRLQADQFSGLFAFSADIAGLNTGEKTTQFVSSAVTGNYFRVLGVAPALGRLFEPGEGENAGAELTVVLGYAFWQKRFGGDPGVIGRQVRIDGKAATVIGVTSKDFHGVFAGIDMDGYLPLRRLTDFEWSREIFTSRTVRPLTVLGRLKPGISLKAAQASMSLLGKRMEQEHPDTDQGIGIRVLPELLARPVPLPFLPDVVPFIRLFLLLLAALVLVLACMNVANILLVRATVRRREMAIRAALGSGRGRLIRQMLAESLLLALLGAAAGVMLGAWTASLVSSFLKAGTDWPLLLDFRFDWRVFDYSLAAALGTGIFIGIWPALRASQAEAGAALHDGARSNSGGPQRQRVRGALVVAQVAGSLVLLICAGLCVRSLRNAQRLDLGFAPDHLLNVRLNPQWAGYDARRTEDFYRELERRVKAWPEVRSASLAFSVPLSLISASQTVYIEGRQKAPGEQPPLIGCNYVGPGYFETMRDSDPARPRVPGIGFRRRAPRRDYQPDHGQQVLAEPGSHREAVPHVNSGFATVGSGRSGAGWEIRDGFRASLALLLHSARSELSNDAGLADSNFRRAGSLSTRLEREIHGLDPNMPVNDLQSMTQALDGLQGYLSFRIGAIQAGAMGVLGLVLALVGVYGVVSYGAAQRTREIGIRMALGATPPAILRIILQQAVWLVLSGLLMGLLGAAALTQVLRRFLLFVSVTDPLTFVLIPALLAVVALLACYIPAAVRCGSIP